ncbi:spermidine/putrescine ABC transporter permease [Kaistia sp. 32K]|uniref:ABC transporter permease n=1 Tax=Kaistia sp. 32K TaxID=2795690 RepID=UPI001915D17C|nr:ABC transporter permease [Kaistia sp. 32K]BCP54785.1 spermidine/putrescine ABC transporter permease [Kaistia sp. 32K]
MSARAASPGQGDFRRRATDAGLSVWFVLAILFLFAPIAVSILYSFNLGVVGKQTSHFTGWTLEWYPAAWNDLALRRSVQTSLYVAFWAALIALAMGASLGYALVRHPSPRVRRWLSGLTYILLIVPEVVIGVSLLLFYAVTGVPLGAATLIAGITPAAIAVTALIVRARALTLDPRLEEAAADLGSTRLKTLWFIVLPQLLPAILAGGLMSYAFCFDNLVVAAFLTTPAVNTLPVYLYGSLQYGPAPSVYAAATVVFLFTVTLLGLAALCFRLSRKPGRTGAS